MPRKLKYERRPELDERVRVYRNLNNGMISVMDKRGRVIAHVAEISLRDVQFVVREAGRQKVLQEKRKNVHAFVVGKVIYTSQFMQPTEGIAVTYNPYKYDSFVEKMTEKPIRKSTIARIQKTGGIYIH